MAIIRESIDINQPVDKVFAYTLDVKSWPKWQATVTDSEQTSQGQFGIGTTFKWVTKAMGLKMKTTAKVTEYEANKKWSKTIVAGSTVIDDRLTFEPVPGGTRFTLQYDTKVGGLFKPFSAMVVSSTRKSMIAALADIKSILEA